MTGTVFSVVVCVSHAVVERKRAPDISIGAVVTKLLKR